ncbi:alpha/beta hydrolase [Flammeovirga sp. MY04]|uniref:alpha/beta hydrolase n=1 Tax=Flammeovirga sp. MY04 TaxID=1191459 RepID=UPI001F29D7C1|nr:alpha/beta hydrolase [Flammeovirga sp. MY04]
MDWITPQKNESLQHYALRLSEKINTREDFILIGVSFGGVVATEIAKVLHPKLTILLSTIEISLELPLLYRIVGRTRFLEILPHQLFRMPFLIASKLFGTKHKVLKDILKDSDPSFTQWAVNALIHWKNEQRLSSNKLRIYGSKDLILPARECDVLIEGGHHFMIVDRANEISSIINNKLDELISN